MTKATTKFLTYVLLGLLVFAAPLSYAFAADAKDTVPENLSEKLIKFQNTWEFLGEKSSEYSDFTKVFGKTAKDKLANVIDCGERRCNLNNSACMMKEVVRAKNVFRDYFNYVSTVVTFGLGNDLTATQSYSYICVPVNEVNDRIKEGWRAVEKDHKNLESTSYKLDGTKERKNEVKECYSALNPKGELQQYCIQIIEDTIEVRAANANKKGCEVIPVRWYNNRKCTFCSLIGVVYAVSEKITVTSYEQFAYSFSVLIAIGMVIWLALKTLSFVSSMTKQDAAKYITELLKQSYKFVFAYFALVYYKDIFGFIILPLLQAGLAFGTEFVSVISLPKRFDVNNMAALKELTTLPSDYTRNLKNDFYSFEIYAALENFAYNVNLQYALLQTIGGSLMCLGKRYVLGQLGSNGWELGLGFGCIVYGMSFSIFGFLLCLAFVFYIFDAIVQIGIVGGLLPFLIASWPFKMTSKYTSTGFKMLLNSVFTFMMMGVVVRISMALINKAVELNTEGGVAASGGSGLVALVDAIDTLDDNKLKIMVNVLSVGFLLFMFANIMGFLLLARVSELVNRFASGGMKPSAPSVATMGASAAKGAVTKMAAPTSKAIGEWVDNKVSQGAKKLSKAAVGLATLRPVRNWAYNKLDKAASKGAPNPEEEKKKNIKTARQAVFGNNEKASTPQTVILSNGEKVKTPQTAPKPKTTTPQTEEAKPTTPQPENTSPAPNTEPVNPSKPDEPVVVSNGRRPGKDDLNKME